MNFHAYRVHSSDIIIVHIGFNFLCQNYEVATAHVPAEEPAQRASPSASEYINGSVHAVQLVLNYMYSNMLCLVTPNNHKLGMLNV